MLIHLFAIKVELQLIRPHCRSYFFVAIDGDEKSLFFLQTKFPTTPLVPSPKRNSMTAVLTTSDLRLTDSQHFDNHHFGYK